MVYTEQQGKAPLRAPVISSEFNHGAITQTVLPGDSPSHSCFCSTRADHDVPEKRRALDNTMLLVFSFLQTYSPRDSVQIMYNTPV
ncbi:hypothetical protein ES703_52181 [subsurface metagenome]